MPANTDDKTDCSLEEQPAAESVEQEKAPASTSAPISPVSQNHAVATTSVVFEQSPDQSASKKKKKKADSPALKEEPPASEDAPDWECDICYTVHSGQSKVQGRLLGRCWGQCSTWPTRAPKPLRLSWRQKPGNIGFSIGL